MTMSAAPARPPKLLRSWWFLLLAGTLALWHAASPRSAIGDLDTAFSVSKTSSRGIKEGGYQNLERIEVMIYDNCVLKDGENELQCLRMLDKLQKFHEKTQIDCNLEDLSCLVLEVLDRLCEGIEGKDGLVLLNKVASAVLAFKDKFSHWDKAFDDMDGANDGLITIKDFKSAMYQLEVGITDSEAGQIFYAADANGDGVVSKDEFADFLSAAVFAEEPLSELTDRPPMKQPTFDEYLMWTMQSREGSVSWASLR